MRKPRGKIQLKISRAIKFPTNLLPTGNHYNEFRVGFSRTFTLHVHPRCFLDFFHTLCSIWQFFFSLSNMVGTSFMPFTHLILFGCCSVLQTSVVQWFCYPFSSQRTFRLFPISCPHITAAIKVLGQAPCVCMQGFLWCVCVGGVATCFAQHLS